MVTTASSIVSWGWWCTTILLTNHAWCDILKVDRWPNQSLSEDHKHPTTRSPLNSWNPTPFVPSPTEEHLMHDTSLLASNLLNWHWFPHHSEVVGLTTFATLWRGKFSRGIGNRNRHSGLHRQKIVVCISRSNHYNYKIITITNSYKYNDRRKITYNPRI